MVLSLTLSCPGRIAARSAAVQNRDLRWNESHRSGSRLSDAPLTRCIASGTPDVIYSNLPIATAVSAMRLEKPHSLSYQDITRTKLPFCTLVWSMWNVEECGSWLKSIE